MVQRKVKLRWELNRKPALLLYSLKVLYLLLLSVLLLNSAIAASYSKYRIHTPVGALEVDNSTIYTLFQDQQGFIWLGTSQGLLRYDGYESHPIAPELANLHIRSIVQQENGDLWFASQAKGLIKLTASNQQITFFKHKPNDLHSISNNNVRKLLINPKGNLYVATSGGGLDEFNLASERFKHIKLAEGDLHDNLYLRDLALDAQGNLWIASRDAGVIKLDISSGMLRFYLHDKNDENSLSSDLSQALYFDKINNTLWIGTWDKGLNSLNIEEDKITRFYQHSSDERRVGPENIVSMIVDKGNRLWLGTIRGVAYYDLDKNEFHFLKHNHANQKNISQVAYYALLCDRENNVWLGSWRGELSIIEANNVGFNFFDLSTRVAGIAPNEPITAVLSDINGELWLGTQASGLFHLDAEYKLIKRYQYQAKRVDSLSNNSINTIYQQKDGSIWVGTVTGGLNKYLPETDSFLRIQMPAERGELASRNDIRAIIERENYLLLGTRSGLNKLELNSYHITPLSLISTEQNYASKKQVHTFFIDSRSRLWLGSNEGLFMQPRHGRFKKIGYNELESRFSSVYGISEDHEHNIWLSTDTGLWQIFKSNEEAKFSFKKHLDKPLGGIQKDHQGLFWLSDNLNIYRFNPKNYQNKVYGFLDGIRGGFYRRAFFRSPSNTFYFGSSYGLYYFKPDRINTQDYQVKVTLSNFLLANQPLQAASSDSPLSKPIYKTSKLTLPYDANVFSFDMSALDYRQASKIVYQYRLLGFDKDWITTNAKNRRITYTNLNAGKYTLSVRGAYNFDPTWGQTTDIVITILPPLWWTWWAKLFYLVLIVLVFRAYYQISKHRVLFNAYERAALTDSLTGLNNRRFLESTIDQDISQSMRLKKDNSPNADVTFFFADLDHFKSVNDQYGHESGDMVLKQFSQLLIEVFRSSDHIIRWGGEEFLIVSRFTQASHAQEMAERLRLRTEKNYFAIANGNSINKTVSIGFTTIPFDRAATCRLSCSQLIDVADKALYYVKQNGRNGWAGISAGDNFELQNFERIASFDLLEKVRTGELTLVSKLNQES